MKTVTSGRAQFAILALLLVLTHDGQAQDTTRSVIPESADSLRTPIVPIPFVGSIERSPTYVISDSMINFADYRNMGDLLRSIPGVFVRDLGSPGQLHGITITGLDARNIAFMSDGVLLNDPLTGVFDPYLYPTEHLERIEVITGPRAFLYGLNSTGAAINLVSKSKKAIKPYTRLRFSEAPYGSGFIDGMFSQNITRGLNLTAGAQHQTFDGRFANSNYDAWNGRVKVRYNMSNKLDFFASYMYNKTQLGLNGGIDLTKTTEQSRYDRLEATVVNGDAYEKVSRHDFQLGSAATFFGDTTAVTTLTLFHSTNLREYRDEENRPNPNGIFIRQDDRSQSYGIKLTQHFESHNHNIDFSIEAGSRGTVESDVAGQHLETERALFAKWEYIDPNNLWRGSTYLRLESDFLQNGSPSTGADVQYRPISWLNLFGGLSDSHRFRSIIEQKLGQSDPSFCYLGGPTEDHQIIEVGLRAGSSLSSSIGIKFDHRISNVKRFSLDQVFYACARRQGLIYQSVTLDGMTHVGSFLIEGSAIRQITTQKYLFDFTNPGQLGELRTLPRWSGTAGLYFRDKLANGHLDLKAGFRVKGFSSYEAMNYNAQYQLYVPGNDPGITGTAIVDFVLLAHLGDAYIHVVWENLGNKKYVVTSFYPMPERQLRFGVSWEFTN